VVASGAVRAAPLVLALIGCPKPAAPAPAAAPAPSGPLVVDDGADLPGADGVRATVVGTLERRRPEGADADGTALVLADGTAVYVSEGPPPDGWDWLVGTAIRVQGTVWARAREGWPVPKLTDPDPPLPADVGLAP
jgi:hypothetical protein